MTTLSHDLAARYVSEFELRVRQDKIRMRLRYLRDVFVRRTPDGPAYEYVVTLWRHGVCIRHRMTFHRNDGSASVVDAVHTLLRDAAIGQGEYEHYLADVQYELHRTKRKMWQQCRLAYARSLRLFGSDFHLYEELAHDH